MKKKVLFEFLERNLLRKQMLLSMFLVSFLINMSYAQNIAISGTVVDESGLPLPGVSVSVRGTTRATQTAVDGKYKISVPSTTAVIEFKFLGFTTQSITVGNQTVINVKLREDVNKLDEVVVVGYGQQAKRDITGSISSVNSQEIEKRVPTNVFEALQGASPGVRVTGDSGAPGGESQITIRGVSSLSEDGGAPLYVVDGVALANINGISPNDIESVEILKDAASAAIYGARSANGVILITTKRGSEGKPRINVNYVRSYSGLAHKLAQTNRLTREIYDQGRGGQLGLYPTFSDSTSYSRNNDNDYQKLVSQTGLRDQVDFSMSGGVKGLTYYTALQYLDDEGIIKESYAKRLTFRTNVDYAPTSKIKLGTRLSFGYQNWNNINEGNVLGQALQRPPQFPLYLPDGSFIYNNGGRRHPLGELLLRKDLRTRYQGVLSQSFDYNILKYLTFHLDGSAEVVFNKSEGFTSALLQNGGFSEGSQNTELPRTLQSNALLNYKQTFNKVHNLTGLLGVNLVDEKSEETNLEGQDHITDAVRTFNGITQLVQSDIYTDGTSNSLLGFFGRVGYDYKGRYYINATYRRDGSSRFGKDNRWGNFPSASVAWRLSDEKFMSWSKKFLSDAKFRVSWGITGYQNIGDFDALSLLTLGGMSYNGVSAVQTSSRLGNSRLKWEEQEQTNVGLDLNLFNGRISFAGDYYIKNTSGLLYDAPLPTEIGYTDNARVNLGSVQNKGFEFDINAYPVRKKNFAWQTALNWSTNRNKVTELPGGDRSIGNLWELREGRPAGEFWGYRYEGIYEYNESNAYTADFKTRLIPQFERDAYGNVVLNKGLIPTVTGYTYPDGTPYTGEVGQLLVNGVVAGGGDVIWQNVPDADGNYNNTIDNGDRQVLGSGLPKWTLGLNNTFDYKNFTFSFALFGSFGNKIYNEAARNVAQFSSTNVTPFPDIIRDIWKYPGQITPQYRFSSRTDNPRRNNGYFLEKGDFIRLQTVRLGYQLPASVSSKVLMKNLNLYLYSNNLATWTAYKGWDPEVSQRNVLSPGSDNGRYPRKREIGFGLVAAF